MEALKTVTIPSNGVFNNGVKEFTLDMIGFEEEKKIFASTSRDAVDEVLSACIKKPENFDVKTLTLEDKQYLLYQLRIHSYGPEYHIIVGGEEIKIDLNDMELISLPEDFTMSPVTLPICGDTVEFRYLTVGQIDKIRTYAEQKAETLKAPYSEIVYELTKASQIATINGETKDNNSKVAWLKGLKGRDLAMLNNAQAKIVFGYTGKIEVDGKKVQVPMTGEFFRPRYDD